MPVNIINRNAPASSGPIINTGQVFAIGVIGFGPTTAPVLCQSIADFEAAFSIRTGTAIPMWDWLDTFFREGGNQAYVLNYTTLGSEAAALALLPAGLGPGQVVCVGGTAGATLYGAIQAHADANNRIGLLDVASTDNTAALLAAKGTLAQALTSKNNVGVFGSWATVPAPAGVIGGTARTVPASAIVAALCQRVDANGNPNCPAGGRDYPLQYATGFVFDPVLAADQLTCRAAGVNFLHNAWNVLENYGFLTPVYTGPPPPAASPFWQLNCSRARMWLQAYAVIIGESYYMKVLDAQGRLAGRLQSDLSALCKTLYAAGGLYGATPAAAYAVNVSASVNNNGTVAAGTLNAVLEAKFSQYADTVNITLVSVPIAGVVS